MSKLIPSSTPVEPSTAAAAPRSTPFVSGRALLCLDFAGALAAIGYGFYADNAWIWGAGIVAFMAAFFRPTESLNRYIKRKLIGARAQ